MVALSRLVFLYLYFSSNPTHPPLAVPLPPAAAPPCWGARLLSGVPSSFWLCRRFQAGSLRLLRSLQLEGAVFGFEPLSRGGGAAAGLHL